MKKPRWTLSSAGLFHSINSGEKQPARNEEIQNVEQTQYPAPADKEEEQKYYEVQRTARAQKYAQPYEAFTAPSDYGNYQKQHLHGAALRVKPSVEVQNLPLLKYLPLRQTRLLQKKFLEKKYPDEVNPAEYNTEYGNEDTYNKSYKTAFFEECRPSYKDFHNPVNAGDEQQDYLNQAALSVEPSHFHVSLFL